MPTPERLAEQFEEHRAHLRAVAYRMLGSLSDAEDAVQEGWTRLSRGDVTDVNNLRAWLTTVIARVCLDPQVVLRADGGALAGASRFVRGAHAVAAQAATFSKVGLSAVIGLVVPSPSQGVGLRGSVLRVRRSGVVPLRRRRRGRQGRNAGTVCGPHADFVCALGVIA